MTPTGKLGSIPGALLLAGGALVAPLPAQALDAWYEGVNAGDFAGFISALGDIDGDSADDYAIGAPGVVNANGIFGEVTVYSGLTGVVLHQVLGNEYSHLWGTSIDGVGDFNGDGVNDFVVGDPGYDQWGADCGAMFVYSGLTGTSLGGLAGGSAGQQLGFQVSGVGDMTGDGKDEVAKTTMINDSVSVYRDTGSFMALVWSWQGQTDNLFGYDVAPAGDVDADGTADIIIGEPWFDAGPAKADQENGRALVYSGATGLLIWDLRGGSYQAHAGFSVDGLGDVNGDGHADLLVGCPGDSTNAKLAGKVMVYDGQTGSLRFEVLGTIGGALLGQEAAAVGDMNGDEINDFGAASPEYNNIGRVSTYSGEDGTPFHDYDHSQGEFWGFVDGGDFDGDGDGDLMIGTSAWVDQNYFNGRVEIYCTSDARWDNYGAGWTGTVGVPLLVLKDDPVIGDTVDLFIGNSRAANTVGLLFLGFAEASIPTGKDGTLLVTPAMTFLIQFTNTKGEGLSGDLPDDPMLCDFELFLQAIEVDPGATKGLSFSRGLLMHCGYDYP